MMIRKTDLSRRHVQVGGRHLIGSAARTYKTEVACGKLDLERACVSRMCSLAFLDVCDKGKRERLSFLLTNHWPEEVVWKYSGVKAQE